MDFNKLSFDTIGAIIEVHRQLGPGLPEAVYQEALEMELTAGGIPFEAEKRVHAVYKGEGLESFFKLDLLVAGLLVVELKSVETIAPVP
jgi:GxxExxY protein